VATEPATEHAIEAPGALGLGAERERAAGLSPWQLALRRLRRNKVALAFGALFIVIVLVCLAAPIWSKSVAHTGPFTNHLTDQVTVGGERKDVVSPDGVPIGPTWRGRFFLGADDNGRASWCACSTVGARRS
jgi:peptide/nickel transport system permease protein